MKLKAPLLELVSNIEEYLVILLMMLMTFWILANIFLRDWAQITSLPGGIEINLAYVSWISWLAMSHAIPQSSHLRFTLVREQLSHNINYAIYWLEWLLWAIILGVLIIYGMEMVIETYEGGANIIATNIPRAVIVLSIPVGSTLALVRIIQEIYITTKKYRNGETITPEVILE